MDLGNEIHTGGSGGRGDLGGEIFGVKVLRSSGNSSSVFCLAAARSVWRWLYDLEIRGRRNRVRGVRESKGKRVVQRREARAHCNDGVLGDQWRHGGLISAAWRRFSARVLGGASVAEGGGFIGTIAWTRGKETDQNSEEIRWRSSRCSTCLSRTL
jgi:hypothetical protein